MSLRWVHVFFIGASITLAVLFGGWNVVQYQLTVVNGYILAAGLSFLSALSLVLYLAWYLNKIKRVP